jgi:centromere/kinetochore protein ZW10
VTSTGDDETHENKLTLAPSQVDSESLVQRLENLSTVLTFISNRLFSSLPASHRHSFPKQLCKPVTTSLLNNLIVTSLPSSFGALPLFLDIVRHACQFENDFIVQLLGNPPGDRPIEEWARNISSHYERKRRVEIMQEARAIITGRVDTLSRTFTVECLPRIPSKGESVQVTEYQGIGREQGGDSKDNLDAEEDSWAFEDGVGTEISHQMDTKAVSPDDEDSAEAWGWSDDSESLPPDDEAAWDDPWNDPEGSEPHVDPSFHSTIPAARHEKNVSEGARGPTNQGLLGDPPSLGSSSLSAALTEPSTKNKDVSTPFPKETYLVSERAGKIITMVKRVLHEGKELSTSEVFSSSYPSPSPSLPGTLLMQAAMTPLELFLALYPVTFGGDIALSPERAMLFSNDCIYLCGEVDEILSLDIDSIGMKDKLTECRNILSVWGDSWFEDNIASTSHISSSLHPC